MKIEGVPEGFELVRIGPLFRGSPCQYIDCDGAIKDHNGEDWDDVWWPIVKKIETPKRYRPFASAEEFKPFRVKWWRWKDEPSYTLPPAAYNNIGVSPYCWKELFDDAEFEDGLPFGIEVTE